MLFPQEEMHFPLKKLAPLLEHRASVPRRSLCWVPQHCGPRSGETHCAVSSRREDTCASSGRDVQGTQREAGKWLLSGHMGRRPWAEIAGSREGRGLQGRSSGPRRTYMVDRETNVVKAPGVMVLMRLS